MSNKNDQSPWGNFGRRPKLPQNASSSVVTLAIRNNSFSKRIFGTDCSWNVNRFIVNPIMHDSIENLNKKVTFLKEVCMYFFQHVKVYPIQ